MVDNQRWTCPSCYYVNASSVTTCCRFDCTQSRPADDYIQDSMQISGIPRVDERFANIALKNVHEAPFLNIHRETIFEARKFKSILCVGPTCNEWTIMSFAIHIVQTFSYEPKPEDFKLLGCIMCCDFKSARNIERVLNLLGKGSLSNGTDLKVEVINRSTKETQLEQAAKNNTNGITKNTLLDQAANIIVATPSDMVWYLKELGTKRCEGLKFVVFYEAHKCADEIVNFLGHIVLKGLEYQIMCFISSYCPQVTFLERTFQRMGFELVKVEINEESKRVLAHLQQEPIKTRKILRGIDVSDRFIEIALANQLECPFLNIHKQTISNAIKDRSILCVGPTCDPWSIMSFGIPIVRSFSAEQVKELPLPLSACILCSNIDSARNIARVLNLFGKGSLSGETDLMVEVIERGTNHNQLDQPAHVVVATPSVMESYLNIIGTEWRKALKHVVFFEADKYADKIGCFLDVQLKDLKYHTMCFISSNRSLNITLVEDLKRKFGNNDIRLSDVTMDDDSKRVLAQSQKDPMKIRKILLNIGVMEHFADIVSEHQLEAPFLSIHQQTIWKALQNHPIWCVGPTCNKWTVLSFAIPLVQLLSESGKEDRLPLSVCVLCPDTETATDIVMVLNALGCGLFDGLKFDLVKRSNEPPKYLGLAHVVVATPSDMKWYLSLTSQKWRVSLKRVVFYQADEYADEIHNFVNVELEDLNYHSMWFVSSSCDQLSSLKSKYEKQNPGLVTLEADDFSKHALTESLKVDSLKIYQYIVPEYMNKVSSLVRIIRDWEWKCVVFVARSHENHVIKELGNFLCVKDKGFEVYSLPATFPTERRLAELKNFSSLEGKSRAVMVVSDEMIQELYVPVVGLYLSYDFVSSKVLNVRIGRARRRYTPGLVRSFVQLIGKTVNNEQRDFKTYIKRRVSGRVPDYVSKKQAKRQRSEFDLEDIPEGSTKKYK